jgi:hypothetical protein
MIIKRLIVPLIATAMFAAMAMVSTPRSQVAAVGGPTTISAAAAGVFPAGATFNSIELAGGTFGVGVQDDGVGTAKGVVEVQLNGTSLIGLSQWITVTGWITSSTDNPDGSVTMNGTGTLDMGDGTAPTGGLAFVANLNAAGITVTIGGTAVPTLPKSDGYVFIE